MDETAGSLATAIMANFAMSLSTRHVGAQCVHLFYAAVSRQGEEAAFDAAMRLWRRYRPSDSDAAARGALRTTIDHFLIRLPTGAFLWRHQLRA